MAIKGTPQDLDQLIDAAFDRILKHGTTLRHADHDTVEQYIARTHAALVRATAQRPGGGRALH